MQRNARKQRWLKIGLSILLTLVSIYLLWRTVDLQTAFASFRQSDPRYIILALLFYIVSYTLRAIRLQRLYKQQHLPLAGLWHISSLHNLMNYLLPLRTGDLSLIYFLKRRFDISLGAGAGVWLIARLLDMIVAMLLLAGAIIIVANGGHWHGGTVAVWFVMISSVLFLGGLWFLPTLGRKGVELYQYGRARYRWLEHPLITRIAERLVPMGIVLEASKSRWLLFELLLISVFLWVSLYGVFWASIHAVGIRDLSIAEIVIGSSGAVIVNFLPINSVASIGTLEAGWTAGFSLIGVAPEHAMISGIVTHLWIIIFAVLLVPLGVLFDVSSRFWHRFRHL